MEVPSKIKTAVTLHRIYGWIYIVIGGLGLLFALTSVAFPFIGVGMGLLTTDEALGSLALGTMLGLITLIVFVVIGSFGIFHIITAKAITERKEWAKIAGIILAVLMLGSFPLGTIFAIFILIGLFDASANEWFVASSPSEPVVASNTTPEKK